MERRVVAVGHEHRGLTGDLAHRAVPEAHRHRAAAHRLQERQPEALVGAREDEGRRPPVEGHQIRGLHEPELPAVVAQGGDLGAHGGLEEPLLTGDDQVDVVVPTQPAGDLHQVGKALARLERPHAEEVGPAQAEAGPRRLDRLRGRRSVPGRQAVGDHVDPLGIHAGDPDAIPGGGAARGDDRVRAAEQPQPRTAQQPRSPGVPGEEKRDEVVDGHDHRDRGPPGLAVLDGVVEAARVATQCPRDQVGVGQDLGSALQPGRPRPHHETAPGEVGRLGCSPADQDADARDEADLLHPIEETAEVSADAPARRIALKGAGVDQDGSHCRSAGRSAHPVPATVVISSSSRRTTPFHR